MGHRPRSLVSPFALILGLSALLLAGGPSAGLAQADRDARLVELAVARHLAPRPDRKRGAHATGAPSPPTTGLIQDPRWSAAHAAEVARSAEAESVTERNARLCAGLITTRCFKRLIWFGGPRVTGDSARMWVYTSEMIERGTAHEQSDGELLAVRARNGWRVAGEESGYRAYSVEVNPWKLPPER